MGGLRKYVLLLSCVGAVACDGHREGSELEVAPFDPPVVMGDPTDPGETPPAPESPAAAHEPDLLAALEEACEGDGPIPDDLVLVFSPAGGRDPTWDTFFDHSIDIVGTRARGRPLAGGGGHNPIEQPWSGIDDWAETQLTTQRVRRAWCELMRSIADTAFHPPRRCQPAVGENAIRIRASWGEHRFVRELSERPGCCPCPIQLAQTQRQLEADLVRGPLPMSIADFIERAPKRCDFLQFRGAVEARVRYGTGGIPSAVDVLGDLPAPARSCLVRLARSLTLRDLMSPSENGRTESYELVARWWNGRPWWVPVPDLHL